MRRFRGEMANIIFSEAAKIDMLEKKIKKNKKIDKFFNDSIYIKNIVVDFCEKIKEAEEKLYGELNE